MTVRVVIADDHPVFRHGLRAALSVDDSLAVVGEAASADDCVAIAVAESADVVLMDLEMPGGGVEATAQLAQRAPEVRVLVLSMHDDGESLLDALRAGARGYLVKGADQPAVLRAIQSVGAGDLVVGEGIAARMTGLFGASGAQAARAFPELTSREYDVLALVADGCDNPTIARRLFLSEKTVRNNVSNVLAKLHAATRAEAVARARRAGLGTPADPAEAGR
jgi:DNA-binding NarL/FixJ family response regulator